MVEAVIRALLFICVVVLCFFLIIWVLGQIGIMIPPMVIVILKVMLGLICILILWRIFSPWIGNIRL